MRWSPAGAPMRRCFHPTASTGKPSRRALRRFTSGSGPAPPIRSATSSSTFRNGDGIYLHDTPRKELFAQDQRDLSHGCVRLEDAAKAGAMAARQGSARGVGAGAERAPAQARADHDQLPRSAQRDAARDAPLAVQPFEWISIVPVEPAAAGLTLITNGLPSFDLPVTESPASAASTPFCLNWSTK